MVKRLERLSERGVPFVIVKALETNQASLGNLRKQGFVEYYRKSVYERSLPMSVEEKDEQVVFGRTLKASDQPLFKEMEKKIMPPFVLHNEEAEIDYFPSLWEKLYMQYARNHNWAQAFEMDGMTVGFLAANHAHPMTTGYIFPPVIAPENVRYLPAMIRQAGVWMETLGLDSVKIEVPEQFGELASYLQDSGWTRQHTWIQLVKWLDDKARQEFAFDG